MHLGLKKNFQVMPGAEWLELLFKHIPDRYKHLARYVGWSSNRTRGERAKLPKVQQTANTSRAVLEPGSEAPRARFRSGSGRQAWCPCPSDRRCG